jgi:hypothetical protein
VKVSFMLLELHNYYVVILSLGGSNQVIVMVGV